MHYAGVDEWSVLPLVRDLDAAYAARLRGAAPDWSPLPVSYADYTRWALAVLGEPGDPASVGARQLDYWRRTLRGIPDEPAPPRPARPTHRGDTVEFVLEADLHAGIDGLARRTRTSMFMVLHAALATLLTDLLTGHEAGTDLPIAAMVAGRTEEALADLVGGFVNIVALRTDTGGDPTFTELLARVREVNLGALDHQDVPFADVAAALGWRPRVLIVHHEQARLGEFAGGLGTFDSVPTGSALAELTLSVYEPRGDGPVHCELGYATDLFDPATVRRLAERLCRVLTVAVTDPDRPLSTLQERNEP
jgi:condensation domain-containing protein